MHVQRRWKAPNHGSHSLGTQLDGRQGGNFLGAHSLPEVEPENHTVPLRGGPVQHTLQVFINLLREDSERDPFQMPAENA